MTKKDQEPGKCRRNLHSQNPQDEQTKRRQDKQKNISDADATYNQYKAELTRMQVALHNYILQRAPEYAEGEFLHTKISALFPDSPFNNSEARQASWLRKGGVCLAYSKNGSSHFGGINNYDQLPRRNVPETPFGSQTQMRVPLECSHSFASVHANRRDLHYRNTGISRTNASVLTTAQTLVYRNDMSAFTEVLFPPGVFIPPEYSKEHVPVHDHLRFVSDILKAIHFIRLMAHSQYASIKQAMKNAQIDGYPFQELDALAETVKQYNRNRELDLLHHSSINDDNVDTLETVIFMLIGDGPYTFLPYQLATV